MGEPQRLLKTVVEDVPKRGSIWKRTIVCSIESGNGGVGLGKESEICSRLESVLAVVGKVAGVLSGEKGMELKKATKDMVGRRSCPKTAADF